MKWLGRMVLALLGMAFIFTNLAKRIKSNPNPYPLSVLQKPLEGSETLIAREDGTTLRTIAQGEPGQRPVVLVHGYGVDLDEWNLVAQRLGLAGYRVIALDLRGHGGSSIGSAGITLDQLVEDVRAVLAHYEVRNGILVGHSTGAMITVATLLEADTPERISGAVIAAGLAGDALRGSPQNRLQIPLITSGMMERIMRDTTFGWFFGASLVGQPPFPAAIEAFNALFLRQDHRQLVPLLNLLQTTSLYPRLYTIRVSTVIVCGDKDRTTPAWHSTTMAERIPGARLVSVPGKGHLLNWEAPEAIVEAIQSL